MFIAPSSRPKLTRVVKETPHDVQSSVGNISVTPVDTLTVIPGAIQLPAFFVSPTGSNNNDGTEASPFETLIKARDSMRSSGTVSRTYARSGTYTSTETIILNTNDANTEWLAYPNEEPIVDPGSVTSGFRIDGADTVTIDGFKILGTLGGEGNDCIRLKDTTDSIITNVTIDGENTGTGMAGIRVQNADDCTISNTTITDVTGGGIPVQNGSTGLAVSDVTITNYGAARDGVSIEGAGEDNCTFTDMTISGAGANDENCIDVKNGTHTFTRVDVTEANQGVILIHQPNNAAAFEAANVTFNDCDISNTSSSWLQVNDQQGNGVSAIFNRCNFHDQESNTEAVTIGATTGSVPVVEFNACAFYIESGAPSDEMFEVHRSASVTFNNCSMISRNGSGSGTRVIGLRSTQAGQLVLKNSIIDADNMWLIIEDAGSTSTFDFQHMLYERGDVATNWFSFQDEGALDESNIGMTSPVNDADSTSGDPDFSSEVDDNANYLLPNSGSPALNLGDTAFAPATDLVGTAYDNPPNSGCREGNA